MVMIPMNLNSDSLLNLKVQRPRGAGKDAEQPAVFVAVRENVPRV